MSPGRLLARARAPLLLALLVLPTGCGAKSHGPAAPGVLLIAVDGLRADHLEVYGYDRETSPALTALAAEGLRFEEVLACAPQFIPAHIGLLTGCEPVLSRRFLLPELEGPNERRWSVPARGEHLAVELLAAGYATAAFVDHPSIGEVQGLRQGFQRYELLQAQDAADWEGSQTSRVIEHFLQWLRALPEDRPWFAYLHLNRLVQCWSEPLSGAEAYFPPRASLAVVPPVASTDAVFFALPRSRWRGGPRTLGHYEAVYDGEIHALDGELAHLFASLRRLGRMETTSLHVVGAFGMQLGEAGLYLDAGRYSRADLGVPWIFRPRAEFAAARGRSLAGQVSTLDVAPTLLALEGLTVPPTMTGLSQAAVARERGAAVAARDFVYASCGLQGGCAVLGERYVLESLQPEGAGDEQLRRSWFGEWTDYERRLGLSFYARARLERPPLEGELPSKSEFEEFTRLREEVLRWRTETNEVRHFLQAPPGRSGLDEEALVRLRARGYRESFP